MASGKLIETSNPGQPWPLRLLPRSPATFLMIAGVFLGFSGATPREKGLMGQDGAKVDTSAEEPSGESPSQIAKRLPAEKDPPQLEKVLQQALQLKPLSERGGLWMDPERKLVVVQGQIVLREGVLELFACPEGTKEHESVVAVKCKSFEVHTALLAAGLVPGKPVQFRPEYTPAEGPKVAVRVVWETKEGKQQVANAQDWIRDTEKGGPMTQDWVFAGSRFWQDEQTGEEYYYADGGEMICVSNFSTAMLDLPIRSTQENTGLMFEALTAHIPPLGTRVYVVLSGIQD